MWAILVYTSNVIIGCGLLLHIIGLAVPSWSVDDVDSSVSKGLWEQCDPECESYSQASVEPIRALVMIAMLCGLVGLILLIWKTIVLHRAEDTNSVGPVGYWFALAFTFVSMLFTITGAILWSTSIHADLDDWHLGAGFGLTLSGGIIIFLGGLVAFIGIRKLI